MAVRTGESLIGTAAAAREHRGPDEAATLEEARECLRYWESREARLPRREVGRRREAREMAERWRHRVAQAENQLYGRGMLGALLLLAAERRLPERSRHAGHVALRTGTRVAIVAASITVLVVMAVLAAAVGLLIALF